MSADRGSTSKRGKSGAADRLGEGSDDKTPDRSGAPLKSSFELAMEKLKARDRDRGVAEDAALSAKQKASIAEIRTQTKAKLAELEILWNSQRPALAYEPEAFDKAQREYVSERARVEGRAESQIASIRAGK